MWADWRRWKEFLPTIYFMVVSNLFYQYIAHNIYHLWENKRNWPNEYITDSLYSFIVFPCTVMLFLSNYPDPPKKQWLHYIKWIGIYSSLEWIGQFFGYISYYHGWSWTLSLIFNCVMFPMLRLHHKRPLWAIGISPFIVFLLLKIFYLD
ncbi:CBO0543 family protein [Paenibacillus vietnamensis]|uniref:CBO0543 family protein n=1 Tax=Paenibacillus vietnamensis TaxID=2590547 RepID=UPI0037C6E845